MCGIYKDLDTIHRLTAPYTRGYPMRTKQHVTIFDREAIPTNSDPSRPHCATYRFLAEEGIASSTTFTPDRGNRRIIVNGKCTMCGFPFENMLDDNLSFDHAVAILKTAVCANCEPFKMNPDIVERVRTTLQSLVAAEKATLFSLLKWAGKDTVLQPEAELSKWYLQKAGFIVEVHENRLCIITEGLIPYEGSHFLVEHLGFESVGFGRALRVPHVSYTDPFTSERKTGRSYRDYKSLELTKTGVIPELTRRLQSLQRHKLKIEAYSQR